MTSAAAMKHLTEQQQLGDHANKAFSTAGWIVLAGAVIAALGSILQPWRFFPAYLAAFAFVLSITLGGLFFVILQHLVRAGWSVTVRRVAEGVALNMRFLAVLFLPLLYPMSQGDLHRPAVAHHGDAHHAAPAEPGGDEGSHGPADEEHADEVPRPVLEGAVPAHIGHAKEVWLSFPAVATRFLIYFLIWIGLSTFYFSRSVAQDTSKDPALTDQMQYWAPPAMLLFALSASLGAFDLLMALEPAWFSTIFAVYYFAGSLLSFFATLILSLHFLQKAGLISQSVSAEHYHDVGKFMFAFIVFWAYIGYSQYMLIWYGNLPEETMWYLVRQEGDWFYISLFQVFGHFALPFLLLISRFPKRRPGLLVFGAAYVLVVHFVDMFWVVQPQLNHLGHVPTPILDVGLGLALLGALIAGTVYNLRNVNLIPVGDPRLVEAVHHENY